DNMAPLTFTILNSCSDVVSATVLYVAFTRLRGIQLLALIPLAAIGTTMAHMGAGLPTYNVMNTDWPVWAIELAGVGSVLLALLVVWMCTVVIDAIQTSSPASKRA